MFDAIVLEKDSGGATQAAISHLDTNRLPPGNVTVRVEFSTINYKDALAITGKAPVVRKFPMVPGIDFAGVVEHSDDERFRPGDAVVLNGWGVGETHWGGLSQRVRVNGDWLVPLPAGMSTRQAMSIGTAGYTAMLCVNALERHGLRPDSGAVLVTGANGGVGTIAIALLALRGYTVTASTGRLAESEYLSALGAARVIDRATLSQAGKPLQKECWAGAVDCVGSHTLANVCASMKYRGLVATCGLAQGIDFPASVAPFILRGVTLLGIDSVYAPRAERVEAWERLAKELPVSVLAANTSEISLAQACAAAADLISGKIRGRLVVNVGG